MLSRCEEEWQKQVQAVMDVAAGTKILKSFFVVRGIEDGEMVGSSVLSLLSIEYKLGRDC